MLIKNFLIGLNLTTTLITFIRREVNKFRDLLWPSSAISAMTTGCTPSGTVDIRIWLNLRLENLNPAFTSTHNAASPFLP